MAKKTKVVVVCDRHRGEVQATASVEIKIDGDRRTLDLCAEHAAELRRLMRPWLRSSATSAAAAGARSGGGRSRAATRAPARSGKPRRSTDGPAIRAWARDNGYEIPERGRIPAAVREAYTASS